MARGYSLNAINAEIDKCVIRCANCHRIKTAREKGFYRHKQKNMVAIIIIAEPLLIS